MQFPMPVPNVLGHYFSFASIEARVNGLTFFDFTAINYDTELTPGDVYGTLPQKLGTTRGKQNAAGSLEMYLQAWENLRTSLNGGAGYGEVRFPIICSYGEVGVPVKTDVLEACRITHVEYGNSDGTDAAKVTLTLNVMRVLEGVLGRIDFPSRVGF